MSTDEQMCSGIGHAFLSISSSWVCLSVGAVTEPDWGCSEISFAAGGRDIVVDEKEVLNPQAGDTLCIPPIGE